MQLGARGVLLLGVLRLWGSQCQAELPPLGSARRAVVEAGASGCTCAEILQKIRLRGAMGGSCVWWQPGGVPFFWNCWGGKQAGV